MKKTEDILARPELKSRSYDVPQGYFDGLRTALYLIPQREETSSPQTVSTGRPGRMLPWFAMAACAVAAVVLSVGIINKSSSPADYLSYEQMLLADLIPHTGEEEFYYDLLEDNSVEVSTQDDLYDYLISGGASLNDTDYETD